jgi:hypothetical protein
MSYQQPARSEKETKKELAAIERTLCKKRGRHPTRSDQPRTIIWSNAPVDHNNNNLTEEPDRTGFIIDEGNKTRPLCLDNHLTKYEPPLIQDAPSGPAPRHTIMQHQHIGVMGQSRHFPDHYLRMVFHKQRDSFTWFIMVTRDVLHRDVVTYICQMNGMSIWPSVSLAPEHRNVDYRDTDLPSLPLWDMLDKTNDGYFCGTSRWCETRDDFNQLISRTNVTRQLTDKEVEIQREAAKYDAPLFHRIREYKRLGVDADGIIRF